MKYDRLLEQDVINDQAPKFDFANFYRIGLRPRGASNVEMEKITSSNRKVSLRIAPAAEGGHSIVIGSVNSPPTEITEQQLIDICADSIEAFLAARLQGPVAAPREATESPEPVLAEDLNAESEKKNQETH